jgi:uncharacterized protein YdhG (YjbR/CyaY superfamily)
MLSEKTRFKDIDAYIKTFPSETRQLLQQLRLTISKAAPKAEEIISYNMPAYKYKGQLVYFAGYKNHIGFYPTGSGIEFFKDQLTAFKTSKGTVQFPLDKALPVSLITRIVKHRVKENEIRFETKKILKSSDR